MGDGNKSFNCCAVYVTFLCYSCPTVVMCIYALCGVVI